MSIHVYANEEVRRKFGAETLSIDLVLEGFYDKA
jgi:hypothetical protein